jgi:hypothetical protein
MPFDEKGNVLRRDTTRGRSMLGLFVAVLHAGASTADDSFVPMAAWGETFLFRLLKSPHVLAAKYDKVVCRIGTRADETGKTGLA